MAKIQFEINTCLDNVPYHCPYLFTEDTPETIKLKEKILKYNLNPVIPLSLTFNYKCNKTGKYIAKNLIFSEGMPKVPEWCPFLVKEDTFLAKEGN